VLLLIVKGSFVVSPSDFVKISLTGSIVAIHWITFFISGRISNPSTSLVGFATCSFWAALIEPIAKRKKIQTLEVGLGIVVLIGLILIFSFNFDYAFGLFLGIISGLTAAIFSVVNSKIAARVSAQAITLYEMIGACATVVLFFPIYREYVTEDHQLHLTPTAMDWVYIGTLAIAARCMHTRS
jgi:drug/metabolite transporter (DMT)-like permease